MPSMTLDGFTAFLRTRVAAVKEAQHAGLEAGAQLIEHEAKAEVGTYQPGAGPFPAWPSLADATQAERARLGYSPDDPGLRSGEMRDSITHSADETVAHIGSNDPHLVYFEAGTSRQPPRSVLGNAAFRKGEEAAKAIGSAVERALAGHSQS